MRVELDPATDTAIAVVPDRQLSLAIGKEGQNARLAAKLTGWSVDIMNSTDAEVAALERAKIAAEVAAVAAAEKVRIEADEHDATKADATEEMELPDEQVVAAVAETHEVVHEVVEEFAPEPEILEIAAEIVVPERTPEELAAEEAAIMAELEREEQELRAALEAEERDRETEEAAKVAETTSLRNLPEDIWTIPTVSGQADPSGIRFAEDIDGLRGGVTARRTRRNSVGNTEGQPQASAARGGRRRGRGRTNRRRR
jgi:hypothetical protein